MCYLCVTYVLFMCHLCATDVLPMCYLCAIYVPRNCHLHVALWGCGGNGIVEIPIYNSIKPSVQLQRVSKIWHISSISEISGINLDLSEVKTLNSDKIISSERKIAE